MTRIPTRYRQRGAALFMVMVILIAMAWFALSGFRISGQHLQLVGNAQSHAETIAVAQRSIEQVISSSAFTTDPGAVALSPILTDVDGDGDADYTVTMMPPPKCYNSQPIKTAELNPTLASDRQCLVSASAGGGGGNPGLVEGPGGPSASGNSLCSSSNWNIAAVVTDATAVEQTRIDQGVGIRVASDKATSFCK
jgi:hypothetical protein